MKKSISGWYKLTHMGCEHDSEADTKEIIFLNRFVVSQLLIILAYTPLEFFLFDKRLIPGHLIYGLLSLFCLVLNHYKKFNFSKSYFIILMDASIFYWVLEVGGKTETEFFYLAAALFGFLLFRRNQWIVIGQMILSILLFFLVRRISHSITPPIQLTDEMAENISSMSNLIIFILIFIILKHLTEVWTENTESLKKKNTLIEQKSSELSDSIDYAERIQRSLIPKMELIEEFIFNGFKLNMPRNKLSGDFSFYHKQSDTVIWIGAADCTGHGIPGSLVSVLGVNILYKAISEKKLAQPNEVLDFATIEMEESLNRFSSGIIKDGMDIGLVRLEKKDGIILFSYAGANNPIWLLTDNEDNINFLESRYKTTTSNKSTLVELPPDRQPIGSFIKKTRFTCHQLTLKKGTRIFLFSDGYADQFGGSRNKKLTKARFKQLLLDNSDSSIDGHTKILRDYMKDWSKGFEQVDDILVMGIQL